MPPRRRLVRVSPGDSLPGDSVALLNRKQRRRVEAEPGGPGTVSFASAAWSGTSTIITPPELSAKPWNARTFTCSDPCHLLKSPNERLAPSSLVSLNSQVTWKSATNPPVLFADCR